MTEKLQHVSVCINQVFNLVKYALLVVCITACVKKAPVEVEQLFVYEVPPGQTNAAAYMLLRNNTEMSLVLNFVHSPLAADVEVHRMIYDQGMMQMRKVNHLSVDPGEEVLFEPGGYHLMLMGIDALPEVGNTFDITMEFESGYKITSKAEVKSIK